jgi:RNA polymerase sigma-70 factor (sigma-E family)
MTFEEFAVAGSSRWLSLATVMGGDSGLAQDAVQEVLIRVHSRWDLIEPMAHRDAYVHRMLVNELTSSRRRWGRLVPTAILPERGSHPDHAVGVEQRDELVRDLLELPQRQRAVIAMRYWADMSDQQIADAMGCRASTVRAYAARALAALRIGNDFRTQTTERHGG